ncbi:MAG: ATP-dependent DNA helicase [Candidatus Diapherotrites archaeon]
MKIYFPYENVRDEQKKLINDIVNTLNSSKTLLANAPTGLGKTVSSLAPALSFAIEHKKKVFFLTPKSSQHEIAMETSNLMNEKFGLKIKTVDLVGKKKMCIHPLVSHVKQGFYETCSAIKKKEQCNFYINTKGKTLKQKANAKKRKQGIEVYGKTYFEVKKSCTTRELCPYEVTLEMIKEADLVIGDYFHIFNEDIRESILGQANIKLNDCILIIDEAHNLSKRIRDMLATTLKVDDIEKASKEAKEIKDQKTEKALKEIADEFVKVVSKIPLNENESLIAEEVTESLKALAKKKLERIEEAAGIFMNKNKKEKSYLLTTAVFLHNLILKKKHTLQVAEMQRNSMRISLYPLDPSEITESIFKQAYSAILMSGTLSPLRMHSDVLGLENPELKEYLSPFPKENRLNIFVNRTTTKYTERNSAQYEEIAKIIEKVTNATPGNSIVFFPSFNVMNGISPNINISRKMLEQKQLMSQDEKSKLIKEFKALASGFGGVLLAVSGGSIAEGVDFPGENLKCAIIVGIPFERVSLQSKALIELYDKKFKKGWDYAYNGPAISKAVQAAGRVIRSEKDKGACVFLDKRFLDFKYKQFFPKEFESIVNNEPEKLVKKLFE